jgi:DNA-binding NarL/FixJ family response regulator
MGTLQQNYAPAVRSLGRAAGSRQIAEALHLSVKTVESHRHRINRTLKLEDGAELGTSRYSL